MDDIAKKIEELMTGLGAIAEMSLTFYRALIASGATEDEAEYLTRAFMAAGFDASRGGTDKPEG